MLRITSHALIPADYLQLALGGGSRSTDHSALTLTAAAISTRMRRRLIASMPIPAAPQAVQPLYIIVQQMVTGAQPGAAHAVAQALAGTPLQRALWRQAMLALDACSLSPAAGVDGMPTSGGHPQHASRVPSSSSSSSIKWLQGCTATFQGERARCTGCRPNRCASGAHSCDLLGQPVAARAQPACGRHSSRPSHRYPISIRVGTCPNPPLPCCVCAAAAVMSAVVEAGAFVDGGWGAAAPPAILQALQAALCMRRPANGGSTSGARPGAAPAARQATRSSTAAPLNGAPVDAAVDDAMEVDAESPPTTTARDGTLTGVPPPLADPWVAARDTCLQWGLHLLHAGLPDPAAAPTAAPSFTNGSQAARASGGGGRKSASSKSEPGDGDGQPSQGAPLLWGASCAGELVLSFLQRYMKRMLGQFGLGVADAAFRVGGVRACEAAC